MSYSSDTVNLRASSSISSVVGRTVGVPAVLRVVDTWAFSSRLRGFLAINNFLPFQLCTERTRVRIESRIDQRCIAEATSDTTRQAHPSALHIMRIVLQGQAHKDLKDSVVGNNGGTLISAQERIQVTLSHLALATASI
jgi:hypothetical protein